MAPSPWYNYINTADVPKNKSKIYSIVKHIDKSDDVVYNEASKNIPC